MTEFSICDAQPLKILVGKLSKYTTHLNFLNVPGYNADLINYDQFINYLLLFSTSGL